MLDRQHGKIKSPNAWTPAQWAHLRAIVVESIESQTLINWQINAPLLGHSVGSCKVRACALREEITGTTKGSSGYQRTGAWTIGEVSAMRALVEQSLDEGHKIDWTLHKARFPRRGVKACVVFATFLRSKIRAERGAIKQQDRPVIIQPLPGEIVKEPPAIQVLRTGILTWNRTLRDRIAAQGVTAGVLGDPPPGRSALDQKRREAATP